MAIQIPNAPQLEADPYARSRSAFNEVLSVFKEQRAMKQNARMMAQKFEGEMKLEAFKGQIDLAIRQEIGKQTFAQDMIKLEATSGIQRMNDMYKQMNERVEGYKKNFDGLNDVYSSFNTTLIEKPRFVSYVDPETGAPVIKAVVTSEGEQKEISEAEIETYYNQQVSLLKPVSDFIKDWEKNSGDILEETTATRIGRGAAGMEFIRDLKNFNRDAIQKVLNGDVAPNKKGTTDVKEVDKRLSDFDEIRQGLNLAIDGRSGKLNLGNFSFDRTTGKLISDAWYTKGVEVDFTQNNVIDLVDKLSGVKEGWFDSLGDEEVAAARILSGEIEKMLNAYVKSQTVIGTQPPTIREFFGDGSYFINPSDFSIQRKDPKTVTAGQSTGRKVENQLYENLIK